MTRYFEYIDNEDLFRCIDRLYGIYASTSINMSKRNFFKNNVDPIKFLFDSEIGEIPLDDYLANEIQRKNDKTISNAIGTFHEQLIGCIEGYTNLTVGNGIDIVNDEHTLYAEVKNKHNTVKGEDLPAIFNKLKAITVANEEATCYFVRIIDKKSQNEVWDFHARSVHYRDERIRIISGDKFYELITGDPLAFKKLCDALPLALEDFLSDKESLQASDQTSLITELKANAVTSGRDLLDEIYCQNFPTYLGFNDCTE